MTLVQDVLNMHCTAVEVQRVLDDGAALDLHQSSSDFWVMAAAVRHFVQQEGNGQLPLQVRSAFSVQGCNLVIVACALYVYCCVQYITVCACTTHAPFRRAPCPT